MYINDVCVWCKVQVQLLASSSNECNDEPAVCLIFGGKASVKVIFLYIHFITFHLIELEHIS